MSSETLKDGTQKTKGTEILFGALKSSVSLRLCVQFTFDTSSGDASKLYLQNLTAISLYRNIGCLIRKQADGFFFPAQ